PESPADYYHDSHGRRPLRSHAFFLFSLRGCNLMQAFSSSLHSKFDVGIGMGNGNERSFKLRRSKKDATFEHATEILGVALGVRLFGGAVVVDGLLREEERSERSNRVDMGRKLFRPDGFANRGNQGCRELFDAFV